MTLFRLFLAGSLALSSTTAFADEPKPKEVYTDATEASQLLDFHMQGEYKGDGIGAQVIALGKGNFQAVVYPGGLPGDGWDGKNKSLVAGVVADKAVKLSPATGKRKYLAGPATEFSATSKFPPDGQVNYSGSIQGGVIKLETDDGRVIMLKKVTRQSPTLGMKAPEGATVLFDGTSNAAWTGGRVDEKTKLLNTDGKDINTKAKFNNYSIHLEFMLPYRPDARGQGRGNSGFYQVLMYEVQVLDSFGLDGKNNECGGVYTKAAPKVNMCYPPLTWQTYDAEFTNAVSDKGKVVKKATLTLKHNGVIIHDQLEIDGKTGGARNEPEGTPGPLQLQGHGNPLQYRNIWIIEKK